MEKIPIFHGFKNTFPIEYGINKNLISNKKSKGVLKFFPTLRSSNISHFVHLAVFQKVYAQF